MLLLLCKCGRCWTLPTACKLIVLNSVVVVHYFCGASGILTHCCILFNTVMKLQALGQCIPLPRHVLPVSQYRSGSLSRIATKFNHLFIGTLSTFPENFMQIRSEVFAQSCWQTDRQTTTITYALSEVKKIKFLFIVMDVLLTLVSESSYKGSLFHEKSDSGQRKHEARPATGTVASCFLECFDTDGWVTERASSW